MKVSVKKILFIGLLQEKEHFFKEAQKLGRVEFIYKSDMGEGAKAQSVKDILRALKILSKLPLLEQEALEVNEGFILASKIARRHNELEKLTEEKRLLEEEISKIKIFGDFAIEEVRDLEKLGKRKIQFFYGKQGTFPADKYPEVIYIGSQLNFDYFVAIGSYLRYYENLEEISITHSLSELRQRLQAVGIKIEEIETFLKESTRYTKVLQRSLYHEVDKHQLQAIESQATKIVEEKLFFIEGWVPEIHINKLRKLSKQRSIYFEEVVIEKEDKVPTYLKNSGTSKIGEDLVKLYDIPTPQDRDTSPFVLWAFAFFFAIILGDGGYGLIFLLTSLFLRSKTRGIGGFKKRFANLCLIISLFCIGWGILTHSFFGIHPAIDNPARKVSLLHWGIEKKVAYHWAKQDDVYDEWTKKFPQLLNEKDPKTILAKAVEVKNDAKEYVLSEEFGNNILLDLALLIGIIHLSVSFIIGLRHKWSGIGWILFMLGGYLFLTTKILKATSIVHVLLGGDKAIIEREGFILLMIGFSLAIILAVIKEGFKGLLEFTEIMTVFSDVLSYLRLYALGLAGGLMAATFNDLAHSSGMVVGTIILIAGHATNIALSIVGGVIHGLRLNFLEWYRHFYQGGGKIFTPFTLHKLD